MIGQKLEEKHGMDQKKWRWTTLEAMEAVIGVEALATLPENAERPKEKEKESKAKAKANLEARVMAKEEAKDGRREDLDGDRQREEAKKVARRKGKDLGASAGIAEKEGIGRKTVRKRAYRWRLEVSRNSQEIGLEELR